MYIAKRNFNSMIQGKKEKGDSVEYNATWDAEGLIEKAADTKPEPKQEIETKPELTSKKKQHKKAK